MKWNHNIIVKTQKAEKGSFRKRELKSNSSRTEIDGIYGTCLKKEQEAAQHEVTTEKINDLRIK